MNLDNYDVRINSSKQYYYNASNLFLDEFEVLTSPPVLTGISFANEDDGGWGEAWNFSINMTDPNAENVNVTLYFSTDNTSWILQNSTSLVCPCIDSGIVFNRSWNETYIGTSYFQFRADDGNLGEDNSSTSVSVLKDDVSSTVSAGAGVNLDRDGTASTSLEVTINDTDKSLPVLDGTNCSIWTTKDGSNFDTRYDSVTSGNVCSYSFDPDSSYAVGSQNFKGGVFEDTRYNDENSSIQSLTLFGDLLATLKAPTGTETYEIDEVVNLRWNITDDSTSMVNGVVNSVEVISSLGVVLNACNFGQITDEGNGWYNCMWTVPLVIILGDYDVRINSSKQYYYNNSDLFLDEFEVLTTAPVLSEINSTFEDDGGWGEAWSYSVKVTDPNTQFVDVDMYFSTNNIDWILQEYTTISCPCVDTPVSFDRDPGWNETYIGTSYFQFRADDQYSGLTSLSTSVTVDKDDVQLEYFSGNNSDINRSMSADLEVRLFDLDREVYVSGESVDFWGYYDSGWNDLGSDIGDVNGNSNVTWVTDCTVDVGWRDWKANITNANYNDEESLEFNIIVRDYLNVTLDLNKTMDVHYDEVVRAFGNVYDCFGWVADADLEIKVSYPNGTETAFVNLSKSNLSGDYVGDIIGGWVPNGTYSVDLVASGEYFFDNINQTFFEYVNPTPTVNLVETYLDGVQETQFLFGEVVTIRANVTDPEDNLDEARVTVTAPSWTPFDDVLMSCVTPFAGGCIYEFNVTAAFVTESGGWNISVDGYDLTGFSNNGKTNFSVSQSPALTSESIVPLSAGWGETFTFNFQVREPDQELVSVILWESVDGISWEKAIAQNYTPTSGGYFVKNFYINSTNCSVTSEHAVGDFYCNPHNKSLVGTRYWKLNVTDFNRGADESEVGNYNIEKDNVTSEYLSGDGVVLNRNSETVELGVKIKDDDREVYVESNVSGAFYDDVSQYLNVTDSNGELRYTLAPDCSYSVGSHNWVGGTYGDAAYEDKNSSSKSFSVTGWLRDSLVQPSGGSFNVSENVLLRSNLTSECGDVVSGATVELEVLDSNNNSYICSVVNDEGSGYYNCSWDSSVVDEGTYSIRINSSATNYNVNSTYYKDVLFLNNQDPTVVGLVSFPLYGGWGERFDYSVNISDIENDDVTCTLWVNTTGVWTKKNSMTSTAPYMCELSVDDYTSSDIGLYFYKFQLNDSFNEVNTSDQLGILVNGTIEEDDVRVEHLIGDNSAVSRVGTNVSTLGVRLQDLDREVYVSGEDIDLWVYYNSVWNNINRSVTDVDGNVTYDWNPGCDVEVGSHNWKGNYSGTFEYKADESSEFATVVNGALGIDIDYPVNAIFHKNDVVTLNSTVIYDCADSGASVSWELDSVDIASGEKTSWQIPTDYSLGPHTLNVSTNKSYYTSASNSTSFEVWGYSEVNMSYPIDGMSHIRGELEISCSVNDSFGGGINNYPVEFIVDDESVFNGTTDANGIFNYTWNSSTTSPGYHEVKCRIRNNDSLYYNASVVDSYVDILVTGGLDADVTLDPSVPGPLTRVSGGTSSSVVNWSVTNVRDENDLAVAGVIVEVYWKEILIGNTLSGSYNIPDDNPLDAVDDIISINLSKVDYSNFSFSSLDYNVNGVISSVDSVATWTPSGDYIDNYIGGPEGGPDVEVSYVINDSNDNILVEGVDYSILKTGDHNATTNAAGTSILPGVTFSGMGDYEGEFSFNKSYLIYGYLVEISDVDWEPAGTCLDNFAPTTVACGSSGLQPAVDYGDGSLVVIDNLGNIVNKANYSEPSGGDSNENASLKLGDWNPLDNVAGDFINATILVTSGLDAGTGGFWHGEVNLTKEFTVWDRSYIQPMSPPNGEDVYRSTCDSPDNLTLRIYLEDDLISPQPAMGATVIFYTSSGNCTVVDNGDGNYDCTINPEDTITPGSYTWDAEALEIAPYHGSNNFSDSWGLQAIDVMGCLNATVLSPPNQSGFTNYDNISIQFNLTDELGNSIDVASVTADVVRHDTTHAFPTMNYNISSNIWDGIYSVLGTDPEGNWGVTLGATKNFYRAVSLDKVYFNIAGILTVMDVSSQARVDRGGDWGYGENAMLSATINVSGGPADNVTVYFFVNGTNVGVNTTNSSGVAIYYWNPNDAWSVGTYFANVTTHSLYSLNYSGGNAPVDLYGRLLVSGVESGGSVDRQFDNGHGTVLDMNATVIDDLGAAIDNAMLEFYVDLVGQVDSDFGGVGGFYEGTWDPAGALAVGAYDVYANARDVAYYHNYTDLIVNSSSDVYGALVPSLSLNRYDVYRNDSFVPSDAILIASVVDENGADVGFVNFDFTVDDTNNSGTSDAAGKLNWTYNPEDTKTPNNYSAYLNSSKAYYWNGSATNNLIIRGVLVPNITLPLNYTKFYRGNDIDFESILMDENGLGVVADSYDWEFVQNAENLGALQNVTWNIPVNYGIGDYDANLSVDKQYYDSGFDLLSLRVFGGSVVELVLEPSIVYRGNTAVYQANVRDTNGTNLEGYNCSWLVDDLFLGWSLTNGTGICSYSFDPICSYLVGSHDVNVSIGSSSGSYYDTIIDNDNSSIAIWDVLDLNISLPLEGAAHHRTDAVNVNSVVGDSCSIPPTDSYAVNWTNETNVSFALTQGGIFNVPATRDLGLGNIKAEVTGNYYDSDLDLVNLYTYGWSRIDNISIASGAHLKGEQLEFNCTVTDYNTTLPIFSYPVEFLEGGISRFNTTTDVNGVAGWTWDTTTEEPSTYNIECKIRDNATLYYNISDVWNQSSDIEIESKLGIMELVVDNYTLYRKDSEGVFATNFTMRISESALGPLENAIAHVYTPDGELNCTSNAQGYCSVIWNPSETLPPENYTIDINATLASYDPSDTSQVFIIVRGRLALSPTSPTSGTYHKGDNLDLTWTVVDENNNQVGLAPVINWYNNLFENVAGASGWTNSIVWQIPLNYKLGPDTLYANASRAWFDTNLFSVDTLVYGYSEVDLIEPSLAVYDYGETREIICQVNDSNMTTGIENYSVDFYYDSNYIGTNITNATGYAVHDWNPVTLDNYSIRCLITDDDVLYYNDSISEDSNLIQILDTTLPVIESRTIIPTVLETHQDTVFAMNVTDDINVSHVWVEILKPDLSNINISLNEVVSSRYTIDQGYPLIYGRNYNVSYSPDLGGFYNLTFKVNDTSGNVQFSSVLQFEAIALTDVETLLLPGTVSVEDISQISNSTFAMNVTCTNIGRVTAYDSGIEIGLPVNWVENLGFPQSCGDVLSGDNCIRSFNVTVPEKEIPGFFDVLVNCTWTNPDLTDSFRADNTTVTVTSNAILELEENLISAMVTHNTANTTTFAINSTGNDDLNNITFNCSSGVVCSDFVVDYDFNNIDMIPGENKIITVTVGVPLGYNPGIYYGEIFANATDTICYFDYCYNNLTLEVVVPITKTWERDISSVVDRAVFVNTTGYHSNITINNTGNVPLVFNMSSHDGVSDLLQFENSVGVPKQSTRILTVDYDIPLTKFPATYTGNFKITPEVVTVPNQLNTSMSFTVSDNVKPIIHEFTIVTPSTPTIADMNFETVVFEANVTDNIGLSNVWVCDDFGTNMEFAGGFGGCEVMADIGNNIFQYNHTHAVPGEHIVYIFARDNYGNQLFSNIDSYRIIPDTDGEVLVAPEFIEITNVTYFDNSTFNLEIDFNNLLEGGAYVTNISMVLPNVNFSSNSLFEECGKVEEFNVSGECVRNFLITAITKVPAGNYDVDVAVDWVNANGILEQAINTTTIKITDKTWSIRPLEITKTIFNNISGEYGQINITNDGEIDIFLDIGKAGNGSSLISFSNNTINLSVGESYNLTVYYDVPIGKAIGDYEVDVIINNSFFYPPQRNTSLKILVADDIDPEIWNPVLSKDSLEPNYENITISTLAQDNVNVSTVWAEIIAPTYSENITLVYDSGDLFAGNYSPKFGGVHNVTIYVNDTSGNEVNIDAGNFLVNATTTADVITLPESHIVSGLVYGQAYSFVVNASFRNLGDSTLRDAKITVTPEYANAWNTSNFTLNCGNVAPGQICFKNFTIYLPDGASPGSKDILFNATWNNSDYTFNWTTDRIDVLVEPNPILDITDVNLSGVVEHGQLDTIGNFSINSLGNTFLTSLLYFANNGTMPSSWVSFFPASGVQTIISAGGSLLVDAIVSIPLGQDPGSYNTTINATSSNGGSDIINIETTIPIDTSWNRTQTIISQIIPPGVTGNFAIDITNLGNVNMTYAVSGAGAGTALVLIPSSVTVEKQVTDQLLIPYTISPDQTEGIYTFDVTMENSSAVPTQYMTTIIMDVKDIGPIIANATVAPPQVDINYESTIISATITDNAFVQDSWVEITLPNETVQSLSMVKDGDYYSVSYVPDEIGFYDILLWAVDNKGLLSNYSLNLTTVGATNLAITPEVSSITFSDITQLVGGSFISNITLDNIGLGGAYSTMVYFTLPSGWSVLQNLSYGLINEGENATLPAEIFIAAATAPGNYLVEPFVEWLNPNGSVDQETSLIQVIVESNPLFEIVEPVQTATIEHGKIASVNFTIQSTGNDAVRGIDFSCAAGDCSDFNVTFAPKTISRLDAGFQTILEVGVEVPLQKSPGGYSLVLRANSTEMEDESDILVTVPTNMDWNATPWSFPQERVGTASKFDLGTIDVESLANVPVDFTVEIRDTDNWSLVDWVDVSADFFTVQPGEIYPLEINYTAPAVGGEYNVTVNLFNPIASPNAINVTLSFYVREFNVDIIIPTNDTPVLDVLANDTIVSVVNVSFDGSPLSDNLTFSAYVEGLACAINNFSLMNAGIWFFNCSLPNATDALSHDFVVEAYYSTIDTSTFDTEYETLVYRDISAPTLDFILAPAIKQGGNTTVLINISDNVIVEEAWVILVEPNGNSTNYTLENITSNLTSATWSVNFSNLTLLGDYEMIVYANDSTGNLMKDSGWFDVYTGTVIFGGIFSDAVGVTHEGDIDMYRDGLGMKDSELLYSDSAENDGEYFISLRNRTYDTKFKVFNHVVKLLGVPITQTMNNPIRFDKIPLRTYLPPKSISDDVDIVLGGISGQTILTASDTEIEFNFTGTNYTDRSLVSVYKCSEWIYTMRICSGEWYEVDNVNVSLFEDIVTIQSSTFVSPAYAVVQEEEGAIGTGGEGEDTGVDGGTVTDGGSSSSSSRGVTISQIRELFGDRITSPPEFEIETDLIEASLYPGESKMYTLWITNNLDVAGVATIEIDGPVWEYIQLDSRSISIEGKSTEAVDLKMFALETTVPGIYSGNLIINIEGDVKDIPITLLVKADDSALMDVKVETITKSITPKGTLKFHTSLYNVGFRKQFDVHLKYTIKSVDDELIMWKEEELALQSSLGFIRLFDMSEELDKDLEFGQYLIEVIATYENRSASSVDLFIVKTPFFTWARIRWMLLGLLLVTLGFAGWKIRQKVLKMKAGKKRYLNVVKKDQLPDGKINLGKVAETDIPAKFSFDDLSTHMIVAGSTGSGKSVTAQVFAEEALNNKLSVVVFDPTAQWTGFVRPCKDDKFLKNYKKFGMKGDDARSYKGMIYEFKDPKSKIDIQKFLNPGEITVFSMAKLTVEEFDQAVANVIGTIFKQNWEESSHLKVLLVFDEVHRLLGDYGGSGAGYKAIEKAAREFRKWGIGIILCSQVLSDFKDSIKGNVSTEVQMHTKGLDDIKRVATKYGEEFAARLTKQEVGVGMLQNPKYNEGKPYFVGFRPLMHSPHKLVEADLAEYAKYGEMLTEIGARVEALKKKGKDVADVELEVKLATDKLKQGRFKMAEIYIESLNKRFGIKEKKPEKKKEEEK
ncbi:DUF87 domain-containing protein [Candidatus Pacearchaeota archaeon]|nr:DUF87 domain-containing protein [Candidatus Pacearchaeota archaeon]